MAFMLGKKTKQNKNTIKKPLTKPIKELNMKSPWEHSRRSILLWQPSSFVLSWPGPQQAGECLKEAVNTKYSNRGENEPNPEILSETQRST